MAVDFTLNGESVSVKPREGERLLETLRERLAVISTKEMKRALRLRLRHRSHGSRKNPAAARCHQNDGCARACLGAKRSKVIRR